MEQTITLEMTIAENDALRELVKRRLVNSEFGLDNKPDLEAIYKKLNDPNKDPVEKKVGLQKVVNIITAIENTCKLRMTQNFDNDTQVNLCRGGLMTLRQLHEAVENFVSNGS